MNTLSSVAVCAALLIAYYMAAGREPIPPDARITFEQPGYRVDLLADGTIVSRSPSGTIHAAAEKAAVRKALRVFRRARFIETDVTRYRGACALTLVLDHRRTSVHDDCASIGADFAKPLSALSGATGSSLPVR